MGSSRPIHFPPVSDAGEAPGELGLSGITKISLPHMVSPKSRDMPSGLQSHSAVLKSNEGHWSKQNSSGCPSKTSLLLLVTAADPAPLSPLFAGQP